MKKSCIVAPEILLPAEGVDLTAWAVIACDQHTSDPAYWEELGACVGEKPSTLRMILPEVYMETEKDYSARIAAAKEAMRAYLARGLFRKLPKGFVLVRRSTPYVKERFGIVLAVDLEQYSYRHEDGAAIRASEATIVERIPPRLKIREGAPLEFPHIMLLYDDPRHTVRAAAEKAAGETLYDFDLNMGGGHLRGRFASDTEPIVAAFTALVRGGMQFMVGDGNHSLATAKAAWDGLKEGLSAEERETHPARFALCEAVNLYDDGIYFEAIHRLVKGVDAEKFAKNFPAVGEGAGALYLGGKKLPVRMAGRAAQAVADADAYIAAYLAEHGGSVDYVHEEAALAALTGEHADYVGVFLPKMDKSELFPQVLEHGSLPRKTFSMGESAEKRYYLEAKEIR